VVLAVLIIAGVFAVPASVVGVRWIRHLFAASAREIAMPDTTLKMAFLGGLRSGSVNATWPLVRLECFDWGIRLRGSARPWRRLTPTWEARYEDLATVQLVSSMSTGIRFAATGRTDAVVFWTFKSSEIMDHLDARGAPVDRSPKSFQQAGGVSPRRW
jgi:hypothetical protein